VDRKVSMPAASWEDSIPYMTARSTNRSANRGLRNPANIPTTTSR
jgi:hypothetical protein